MKRLILGCLLALLPPAAMTAPPVGEAPPKVVLSGADGGQVNGEAWSSGELIGKVHVMFYVDPDEKALNDHVSDALKKAAFPLDKFGSVAAINMKATWLPNSLIERSLAAHRYQRSMNSFTGIASSVC
jgi:predicted transcriptional regulator